MPRRVYPDTNVVQLIMSAWGAQGFEERARSVDCSLSIGIPVMYELARAFIYPQLFETARGAFRFLSEIDSIEILPTLDAVMRAEFHLAIWGTVPPIMINPTYRVLARQEITRLANGYVDDAIRFIKLRELDISVGHPEDARVNIDGTREFLRRHPELASGMSTFAGFREQVLHSARPLLIQRADRLSITVDDRALEVILNDPRRFPVLNTWLNAEWYFAFIEGMHQEVPSAHRIDDFRHLLESANCDFFVTNDVDLLRRGRDIRPFLDPILPWGEFKNWCDEGRWGVSMG